MRILFIALLSLLTLPIQSQEIIDKMAKLTCECMEEEGFDNKSQQEVTNIMSNCLTQHLLSNIAEIQTQLDVEITDQEAMRAVGEKIGTKMAGICPAAVIALAGGLEGLEEEPTTDDENSFAGKITSIDGTEFTSIKIINESGTLHTFIWLGSFDGDEVLLELKEEAIGQKVIINFEELEVYDHKMGKYIPKKFVTGLNFVE